MYHHAFLPSRKLWFAGGLCRRGPMPVALLAAHHRPGIRAVLLAKATATTRLGRRRRSPMTDGAFYQPPFWHRDAVRGPSTHHSMTSSARARIRAGRVRPRAFTVFILTTSSNLVGRTARTLDRDIHIVNVSNESDLEAALATLTQYSAGALLVSTDSFFTSQRDRLVALTMQYALPTIYP